MSTNALTDGMDSPSSSEATETGSYSSVNIYPIPVKDGIEKCDFIAYVGSNTGVFKEVCRLEIEPFDKGSLEFGVVGLDYRPSVVTHKAAAATSSKTVQQRANSSRYLVSPKRAGKSHAKKHGYLQCRRVKWEARTREHLSYHPRPCDDQADGIFVSHTPGGHGYSSATPGDEESKFKKDVGPKCRNILGPNQMSDITAMSWGDTEECDVLIALKNSTVRVFDSKYRRNFVKCLPTDHTQGPIRSISRYNNIILAAFESGVVKNMKGEAGGQVVLKTGRHLWRMRHSEVNGDLIATGGKESNMKLWDLPTQTCLFEAKNVRPDELELRVPVFVSDLCFIPGTHMIATCSKHGYVNVYDTRSQHRRPVLNTIIAGQAFTCIAAAPKDRHVVVGSGQGCMYLLDMRWPNKSSSRFKGFHGGVSAIACHSTEPYVMSTSIDHGLRIHNLDTTALVHKVVTPGPLNFLLLRSDFSFEEDPPSDENEDNDDIMVLEHDRLFNNMETITESTFKKMKYSVSSTS